MCGECVFRLGLDFESNDDDTRTSNVPTLGTGICAIFGGGGSTSGMEDGCDGPASEDIAYAVAVTPHTVCFAQGAKAMAEMLKVNTALTKLDPTDPQRATVISLDWPMRVAAVLGVSALAPQNSASCSSAAVVTAVIRRVGDWIGPFWQRSEVGDGAHWKLSF